MDVRKGKGKAGFLFGGSEDENFRCFYAQNAQV